MRLSIVLILLVLLSTLVVSSVTLDEQLSAVLAQHGFTGRMESALEQRLGRKLDNQLVELGRLLFFDTVGGLNNDNNCSGCHSPGNGFGDSQSIAIGIDNNGIVGPDRACLLYTSDAADERSSVDL